MRVVKLTFLLSIILILQSTAISVIARTNPNQSLAAEDLAEMVLNISPDQVVGQPLLQNGQILLLDSASALLTDYDLTAFPISLIPGQGVLTPSELSDQALFTDGIVSLLAAGVTYSGSSGVIGVHVDNGAVTSSAVFVSFNGYDILDAFDSYGNPISTIYSGLPTDSIHVTVQNGGSMTAATDPYVKSYFKSGNGGSVKHFFAANANGVIDTVSFRLENTLLEPGLDTLVLELLSEYMIADSIYQSIQAVEIPIEVFLPPTFTMVNGSVAPQEVYAGVDFDFSFDVLAEEFPGLIDNTLLDIYLSDTPGGAVVATLYQGEPAIDSFVDNIVSYSGLTSIVDSAAGLTPGTYYLQFDYRLVSGENSFVLTNPADDSLVILEPYPVQFNAGTFDPHTAAAGAETEFSFDLQFDVDIMDTEQIEVLSDESVFRVSGDGFNSSVNLIFPSDTLIFEPMGERVIPVRTERLVVPEGQLGQNLTVTADFSYRVPGSGNALTFSTDFEGQTVEVVDLPLAQIIDVTILAPNAPRVNTSQEFQILCLVASMSEVDIMDVDLELTTDGLSSFAPDVAVGLIPAMDTVEVYYDITASSTPQAEEMFRLDIVSTNTDKLPPINDVALLAVQEPAFLKVTVAVSNGAIDSLVEFGESFNFVVLADNTGEADITTGAYSLTTNGVDMGLADPTTGILREDSILVFFLTAPDFDTLVNLTLLVNERPVDLNSGLPVAMNDTLFNIPVEVASTEAELFAEAEPLGTGLVTPGEKIDLFKLNLTNRGGSYLTDMEIETIEVTFVDETGGPAEVRSLVEVGSTGFYEDGNRLGSATAGGSNLKIFFDDFILKAGQSRELVFKAKIKAGVESSFGVSLQENVIKARFVDPRLMGDPVEVISDSEDSVVIEESYTSSGSTLESSFMIETNPFNPNQGAVRFSYMLSQDSELEFRIFTLVGEQVHSRTLNLGDAGTTEGTHDDVILWDGRNDDGKLVVNGVYIAMLRIVETGDEVMLKVAVVK